MLSLDQAVDEALAAFPVLGIERVTLDDAFGRRLADSLDARRDLPPFDASAMDGYAVASDDLVGASPNSPLRFSVAGEARTGATHVLAHPRGTATRIFTGAELPEGADAVVVQEDTTREGDEVLVRFAPRPGHHVRFRGSDLRAGERLLERGASIGPGEIAMLSSQDIVRLDVRRRPVVAIVSTGDELRDPGEPERRGSIVNSNAHMLAAMVRREGGFARVLPTAPDDPGRIRAAVEEALAADVVITSGGVSVGDHDHVPRVLRDLGVTPCFAKVRMKPGKPVIVGVRGRVPVIGLPGNPASALVGFEVFVAPGLRAMQGSATPFVRGLELPLDQAHTRSGGRAELARGRVVDGRHGPRVVLTRTQSSGAFRSLAEADCLVLFGENDTEIGAGTSVFTVPIGVDGRSERNPFRGRRELRTPAAP